MKLLLIIHSTDPELLFNAFRLGGQALAAGDEVTAFLLASGVEAEEAATEVFPIGARMRGFVEAGGSILACGTCLELRDDPGSELCPASNMETLHRLVSEADRVVSL